MLERIEIDKILGCGNRRTTNENVNFSVFNQPEAIPASLVNTSPATSFIFKGRLCDTSEELEQQLNISAGLSANFANLRGESRVLFSKKKENNNYSRFYLIEITWKKLRKTIIINSQNVKQLIPFQNEINFTNLQDIPLTELEKHETITKFKEEFYRKFGDEFVSEITYGEKLVAVVELSKSQTNISRDWSILAKLDLPISPTAGVGGNAQIFSLLNSLQDFNISNIHIYSTGNGSHNGRLQLNVLDDLVELNKRIRLFIERPLHAENHSQDIKDRFMLPLSSTVPLSSDHATTPIGFSTSSYLNLLQYCESPYKNRIIDIYNSILKDADEAIRYLHAISTCYNRVNIFLNDIDYALHNSDILKLDNHSITELKRIQLLLLTKFDQLESFHYTITHNIFKKKSDSQPIEPIWAYVWKKIVEIADFLDGIKCSVINFNDSSYLIKTKSSKYYKTPLSLIGRSSNYFHLRMPPETERLHFQVSSPASSGIGNDDIKFKLKSSSKIVFSGHTHRHRTLHRHLKNGSYNRIRSLISGQSASSIKKDIKNKIVMGDQENKVYRKVAITDPKFDQKYQNKPSKNEKFKVCIWAQTGPVLNNLSLPKRRPLGIPDHNTHHNRDGITTLTSLDASPIISPSTVHRSHSLPEELLMAASGITTLTSLDASPIIPSSTVHKSHSLPDELLITANGKDHDLNNNIGPSALPNWYMPEVGIKDGTCFYEALCYQLHHVKHSFFNKLSDEIEDHVALQIKIQNERNSRDWADDKIFYKAAQELNIILAIADTRSPADGFKCWYVLNNDEKVINMGDQPLPSDKTIIKLAYTGKRYLPVIHHPILSKGAIKNEINLFTFSTNIGVSESVHACPYQKSIR